MTPMRLFTAVLFFLTILCTVRAYADTCSRKACDSMAKYLKNIEVKFDKLTSGLKYLGELPLYAATSCQQIAELRPEAESGLYWLQIGASPSRVFCDMNNTDCGGGVWTRIANVNMTTPCHSCPSGLETVTSPKRSCRKTVETGSSSTWFSTYELPYKKICGKIIGYQRSTPDAFEPYHNNNRIYTADNCYAEGVLLSYNSPRQHIWTFAAMPDHGLKNTYYGCRCGSHEFQGTIPSFVGSDYFCETGVHTGGVISGQYYTEHALWDGEGWGTFPSGCNGTRSPWFKKEFPYSINSNIELRICMDENRLNEDVLVEQVYIYIQ